MKRKTILEKFTIFTDDELVSKLEVVENINISLINNQYLKAKKGHLKIADLKSGNKVDNLERINMGERIRDMIKIQNGLVLFLEDTASLAFIKLK